MESQVGTIEDVFEKIKSVKICMFATMDLDGTIKSRPMATVEVEKEEKYIYFFTNENSGKINEIANENHVNLSYVDHNKSLFVSVSGKASLLNDKDKIKQLWNPIYKAWFPKGIDDPNLALLKVMPTEAEFWDAPDSKMVQFFGIVKSIITGTDYNAGEHKHVNV